MGIFQMYEFFPLILAMGGLLILVSLLVKIARPRTEPIRFREMDAASAIREVSRYTDGLTQSKFGFPSGVFALEQSSKTKDSLEVDHKSDSHIAVFKEKVFGTVGFEAVKYNILLPWKFTSKAFAIMRGSDSIWKFVAFTISCVLFAISIPIGFFLLEVTLIEFILKWTLRSKITATAEVDPESPADVLVTFTLSGITACLSKKTLTTAFATPVRPSLVASV